MRKFLALDAFEDGVILVWHVDAIKLMSLIYSTVPCAPPDLGRAE